MPVSLMKRRAPDHTCVRWRRVCAGGHTRGGGKRKRAEAMIQFNNKNITVSCSVLVEIFII